MCCRRWQWFPGEHGVVQIIVILNCEEQATAIGCDDASCKRFVHYDSVIDSHSYYKIITRASQSDKDNDTLIIIR